MLTDMVADVVDEAGAVESSRRLVTPGVIRMSELIGALSVGLDITEGQPPGHAARSCLIGMRLAESLQLPDTDRAALFYALLLKDVGCSSNAAKMCFLFGADDRQVKRDVKEIDWTKMKACVQFSWKHVSKGASPIQKMLKMAAMAREGDAGARKLIETRCERGAEIARLIQLPESTALAIQNLDEHWNGGGHPVGLKGEEIPMLARICCLAQTVEVFFRNQGLPAAMQVISDRKGTWFDPTLVEVCLGLRAETAFWQSLAEDDLRDHLTQLEPADEARFADEEDLDRVCEAFARVVDAKSPWTHKHSAGVANIATGIADQLGHSLTQIRDIRRAGLLHDIGKLGVSNLILDKPGKPTDEEYRQIRMHPDYSQRILQQVNCFAQLSDVASAHHERLDGHGYHRQLGSTEMSQEARILAVADVYEALSAKRPYRDELPREKVMSIMQHELGTGLCPETFEAFLRWEDGQNLPSRVDAQLERIDALLAEI